MIKNLHDFTIKPTTRTCYCDFWQGWCYHKGEWHTIERGFLGYRKSEIKKSLRKELVEKLNRIYN